MKSTAIDLLRETFSDWKEDKAPRLGAALAYYALSDAGATKRNSLSIGFSPTSSTSMDRTSTS